MISLVGLKKIYPSPSGDVVALENVNLEIPDGAIYGIIGLSGAGKSTLARCINLLERPTAGKVFVDGEELTSMKERELLAVRRNIGMIFQNFNLLEQRSVEANVRFPLELAHIPKAERRERVAELLELVGLSEKAKAYPSQLSGGQKQRVAIARALALSPKYLLCDEATSALDPATTQSILGLLKEINRKLNVTIVIITHEMSVIESVCTDVAVLDRSKIAEAGKTADVFFHPQSEIARTFFAPRLAFQTPQTEGKGRITFELPKEKARAEKIKELLSGQGITYREE